MYRSISPFEFILYVLFTCFIVWVLTLRTNPHNYDAFPYVDDNGNYEQGYNIGYCDAFIDMTYAIKSSEMDSLNIAIYSRKVDSLFTILMKERVTQKNALTIKPGRPRDQKK